MANYDDTNGVWRTIGGRRVFIREGKSLSEAMKESGKFKRSKKATKEQEEKIESTPRDEIKYALEHNEFDYARRLMQDYGLEDEKDEFLEGLNSKARAEFKAYDTRVSKKEWNAEASRQMEEDFAKAYKDNRKVPDAYKDSMITSRNDDEVIKDLNQRKEQLSNRKNRYTPEEYKEQEDGLNAGIKYAEQQKAGKTYKAGDLEEGKPYEIDMGNGIKKTAIYLGKDTDGNSAFYDGEGVNGTFAFSDNFINEKVKVSDNKDDEKFIDLHSQLRHRDANREHKTKINTAMDVPGRISENKDLAEQIIADDEWNDIQAHYYGGTNAEIVNERTGKRVKITPYDNRETLSKKIEESYKQDKEPKYRWQDDEGNTIKPGKDYKKLNGGNYVKQNEDGSSTHIASARKGDGSIEYTRYDYDKDGNDVGKAKKYKSLEEAKGTNEPKTFFDGKRDIEAEARQIYAEDGIRATSDRNLEYFSKKYDIPKDQAKQFILDTAKRFDEENEKRNRSNDWVRDAFNKYKKDHPKTKLTIQDFMKNQKK